jgi:hypothetical protein
MGRINELARALRQTYSECQRACEIHRLARPVDAEQQPFREACMLLGLSTRRCFVPVDWLFVLLLYCCRAAAGARGSLVVSGMANDGGATTQKNDLPPLLGGITHLKEVWYVLSCG